MNITEFHDFISEVAKELPEIYSSKLTDLRDSLEDLGPTEWGIQIEKFANDLLNKDIGNSEKLVLLQAEAKNCRSLEINPIYLLVGIVLIVIILNSF